jgi:hypothetical protein
MSTRAHQNRNSRRFSPASSSRDLGSRILSTRACELFRCREHERRQKLTRFPTRRPRQDAFAAADRTHPHLRPSRWNGIRSTLAGLPRQPQPSDLACRSSPFPPRRSHEDPELARRMKLTAFVARRSSSRLVEGRLLKRTGQPAPTADGLCQITFRSTPSLCPHQLRRPPRCLLAHALTKMTNARGRRPPELAQTRLQASPSAGPCKLQRCLPAAASTPSPPYRVPDRDSAPAPGKVLCEVPGVFYPSLT